MVISNYRELKKFYSKKQIIRDQIRDIVVSTLSFFNSISTNKHWIKFPYYHHVFDDEKINFNKQLQYYRNFGEFISFDDIMKLAEAGEKIDGRFFCISFDDGFRSCLTNALEILNQNNASSMFFLPTKYILDDSASSSNIHSSFFHNLNFSAEIEFLTWEDCKVLLDNKMEIGSHSVNHIPLSQLSDEKVISELQESKRIIESKLSINCNHFCSPIGIPGIDYFINRDPDLAKELGYKTFSSTERGHFIKKITPFHIKRDHVIAKWHVSQLRYFFSD